MGGISYWNLEEENHAKMTARLSFKEGARGTNSPETPNRQNPLQSEDRGVHWWNPCSQCLRKRLEWQGRGQLQHRLFILPVHICPNEVRLKGASREDIQGSGSACLLHSGWMPVTFVNSSCHCLNHLFPCQLLSEPWAWSHSDLRLIKAWARLISSLCWSLVSLWGVG